MRRIICRIDHRAALLAALALGAALAGMIAGSPAPRTGAQANVYQWWVREDEPPDIDLFVRPVDRSDWSEYIAASDARLDGWLTGPSGAPSLGGSYVTVTFRRPVSVTVFNATVAPLAGVVARYTAIGSDADGNRVEEVTFGAPDEALLSGERYDPGGEYAFDLEGIIAAEMWIGTRRPVTALDLDLVRDAPAVHFADTTAIQVLRADLPAHGAVDPAAIDNVVMDSPWHQLDW